MNFVDKTQRHGNPKKNTTQTILRSAQQTWLSTTVAKLSHFFTMYAAICSSGKSHSDNRTLVIDWPWALILQFRLQYSLDGVWFMMNVRTLKTMFTPTNNCVTFYQQNSSSKKKTNNNNNPLGVETNSHSSNWGKYDSRGVKVTFRCSNWYYFNLLNENWSDSHIMAA